VGATTLKYRGYKRKGPPGCRGARQSQIPNPYRKGKKGKEKTQLGTYQRKGRGKQKGYSNLAELAWGISKRKESKSNRNGPPHRKLLKLKKIFTDSGCDS